jgi:hypothetical protein
MNMPTSVDSDAGWLWHAPSDSGEALAVMDGDGRLVGTVRLDEFVLSVSP